MRWVKNYGYGLLVILRLNHWQIVTQQKKYIESFFKVVAKEITKYNSLEKKAYSPKCD